MIPAQTPGVNPKITNTNGVGITLASNAVVSGVEVIQPTEECLYASNISGFKAQYCRLENSEASAIYATNHVQSGFQVLNNIIITDNKPAVYLDNCISPENTQIVISNNTINSGSSSAVHSNSDFIAVASDVYLLNNTVSGNTLLEVSNNYASLNTFYVKGNSFTGTRSIDYNAINQLSLTFSILNNVFNTNASGGLSLLNTGNGLGASLSIAGNTFIGTSSDNFTIQLDAVQEDAINTVIISQNTFSGYEGLTFDLYSGQTSQKTQMFVTNNKNMPQAVYTLYNLEAENIPEFHFIGNTVVPKDYKILLGAGSTKTWNLYVNKNVSPLPPMNPFIEGLSSSVPINFVSPTSEAEFRQQNTNMGTARFSNVTFNP